jgi:hypothetical protein
MNPKRKESQVSVYLAIATNVVLDLGIVGVLAFVMTRPSRLRPHAPAAELVAVSSSVQRERARRTARRAATRRRVELATTRS